MLCTWKNFSQAPAIFRRTYMNYFSINYLNFRHYSLKSQGSENHLLNNRQIRIRINEDDHNYSSLFDILESKRIFMERKNVQNLLEFQRSVFFNNYKRKNFQKFLYKLKHQDEFEYVPNDATFEEDSYSFMESHGNILDQVIYQSF